MSHQEAAVLVMEAKTSVEISNILVTAKVDDDFLDELVLDCVSETGAANANQEENESKQDEAIDLALLNGSDINNSGIEGQVDFLVVSLGPDEAREQISSLLKEV